MESNQQTQGFKNHLLIEEHVLQLNAEEKTICFIEFSCCINMNEKDKNQQTGKNKSIDCENGNQLKTRYHRCSREK